MGLFYIISESSAPPEVFFPSEVAFLLDGQEIERYVQDCKILIMESQIEIQTRNNEATNIPNVSHRVAFETTFFANISLPSESFTPTCNVFQIPQRTCYAFISLIQKSNPLQVIYIFDYIKTKKVCKTVKLSVHVWLNKR